MKARKNYPVMAVVSNVIGTVLYHAIDGDWNLLREFLTTLSDDELDSLLFFGMIDTYVSMEFLRRLHGH